jgi:glycine/D-amino acid oxidase-like deaminating enzyme
MNQSPWLHQLNRRRPLYTLDQHRREDVVIVGGGIAGMMTAAFTLLRTQRSVLLLEATRIAHGATGHNAGQITSYFERSFPDMVREYGLDRAAEAVRAVESAWDLLDELKRTFRLTTPLHRFMGYVGFSTIETVRAFFETNRLRANAGLRMHPIYLAEEQTASLHLSSAEREQVTFLPQTALLALLETPNHDFIGAQAEQKGVTNSAALCEELAELLLTQFPDRFTILEETPVKELRLGRDTRVIVGKTHAIHAASVVLCTNGFESFDLRSEEGVDINYRFHASIDPTIAYMIGYVRPEAPPTAMSYIEGEYGGNTPYAYMTRRPHGPNTSLLCWGEPEAELPTLSDYNRTEAMPDGMRARLQACVKRLRPADARQPLLYRWHGLMGYTPNRIRLIGQDPCHAELYYNLGCNGIGILPSIYGGSRIAQLLNGETLPITIFDPSDTRCPLPSGGGSTKRARPRSAARTQTRRKNVGG